MRVVNNVDKPFLANGVPLEGVRISFKLVDGTGKQPNVYDTGTGEPAIAVMLEVYTDANGLFSTLLWENVRGSIPTYYHVKVWNGFNLLANFVTIVGESTKALHYLEMISGGVAPETVFTDEAGTGRQFVLRIENDGANDAGEEILFTKVVPLEEILGDVEPEVWNAEKETVFTDGAGDGKRFVIRIESGGPDDAGGEILYPKVVPI